MAMQACLLVPWAFYQLLSTFSSSSSSSMQWSSSLFCLLLLSILLVVEFYTDAVVSQHEEISRVALTNSVTAFLSALLVSLVLKFLSPSDQHHSLSVGAVLAAGLFLLGTVTLTRPVRPSHGLLVGYSTSGLPLYSSHHQPPSAIEKLWPLLTKILENGDSRRIFYFLLLNLVCVRLLWAIHTCACTVCMSVCLQVFTVVEMTYGVWTNSLGLISDGFHMLFDCTALLVGLYAAVLSHWKPTRLYSFGYSKVETLSGFINGLFLVVIACFVLIEALERLVEPPPISTDRLLVSTGSLSLFPFTHHPLSVCVHCRIHCQPGRHRSV